MRAGVELETLAVGSNTQPLRYAALLRVDVRKNQSHKEGVRNRGPSIWLIFTYIVQFFTLILVVLFVFHKNDRMQDYGSLKF